MNTQETNNNEIDLEALLTKVQSLETMLLLTRTESKILEKELKTELKIAKSLLDISLITLAKKKQISIAELRLDVAMEIVKLLDRRYAIEQIESSMSVWLSEHGITSADDSLTAMTTIATEKDLPYLEKLNQCFELVGDSRRFDVESIATIEVDEQQQPEEKTETQKTTNQLYHNLTNQLHHNNQGKYVSSFYDSSIGSMVSNIVHFISPDGFYLEKQHIDSNQKTTKILIDLINNKYIPTTSGNEDNSDIIAVLYQGNMIFLGDIFRSKYDLNRLRIKRNSTILDTDYGVLRRLDVKCNLYDDWFHWYLSPNRFFWVLVQDWTLDKGEKIVSVFTTLIRFPEKN